MVSHNPERLFHDPASGFNPVLIWFETQETLLSSLLGIIDGCHYFVEFALTPQDITDVKTEIISCPAGHPAALQPMVILFLLFHAVTANR